MTQQGRALVSKARGPEFKSPGLEYKPGMTACAYKASIVRKRQEDPESSLAAQSSSDGHNPTQSINK